MPDVTKRRLLFPLTLLVALVLAVPVDAHTQVRRATPGPAEVVPAPVETVVLEFLDPVLPTPSIEVTAPDGAPVAGLGQARLVAEDRAEVEFDPIGEGGEYRVDYRFVALDGDEQTAAYTFTVEAAPDSPSVEPSPDDPAPEAAPEIPTVEESSDGVAVRPILAVLVGAVLLVLVAAALLGRRRHT